MNAFRPVALTLLACVAAATACTSGGSTAGAPATSPAATSGRVSTAAPSPVAAPAASTVAISGSLGSFPVPAGAKIAENVGVSQEIIIFFSGITPAKVSAFYAAVLPDAGFRVTTNANITVSGVSEVAIEFSGHGYKGMIASLARFPKSGVSIAGLGHKNVTNVTLTPQ